MGRAVVKDGADTALLERLLHAAVQADRAAGVDVTDMEDASFLEVAFGDGGGEGAEAKKASP